MTATSRHAGTVVRFRQTVRGVPVWGAETLVGLDLQNRGQLVVNAVRMDVALADVTPALAASAAREAAFATSALGDFRSSTSRASSCGLPSTVRASPTASASSRPRRSATGR